MNTIRNTTRFHKLPACHASTYNLMVTLAERGIEPGVASVAVDMVLGPDPARVLEAWEAEDPDEAATDECDFVPWPLEDAAPMLGLLAARWTPAGRAYSPTIEDWEALAEFHRQADERLMERRLASDWEDRQEAAYFSDRFDVDSYEHAVAREDRSYEAEARFQADLIDCLEDGRKITDTDVMVAHGWKGGRS